MIWLTRQRQYFNGRERLAVVDFDQGVILLSLSLRMVLVGAIAMIRRTQAGR